MAKTRKNIKIESLETLNQLILQIYDAAIEPARWSKFLESMSDICNGQPMGLLLHDKLSKKSYCNIPDSFVNFVRAESEWIADFERYYCTINPWMEQFARLPEGAIACTSTLIRDEIFFGTEFYNDWLKKMGYRYSLGAPVIHKDSLIITLFGLRTSMASPEELKLCKLIIPHIQRACTLQMNMVSCHALMNAGYSVLDRFSMGILLLDGKGRVCFANKAAETILQKQDGFFMTKESCCEAGDLSETAQLQHLIGHVVQTGSGEGLSSGGALRIGRMPPKRPLQILVSPLRCNEFTTINDICGVIFVSDPDDDDEEKNQSENELLQQLYGLTTAQSQLAQALSKGVSIEDYAKRHRVTLNTARTHLKQLLIKTNTHRQGELVHILLSGPAFMRT